MKTIIMTEIKERLVAEFRELKTRKPGKEWRRLLKSFNVWHGSDEAGHIWRNAGRGLAGSEGLRQLVTDMNAILKSEKDRPVVRMSPAEIRHGRESTIASSSSNLRRRKRGIGVAAK